MKVGICPCGVSEPTRKDDWMIFKYRTQVVVAMLAGASFIVAESGTMKVASGRREILL